MKYMFLVYIDEKAWAALSEAEQQRAMSHCKPHIQQLTEEGKFLGGAPLHPTSTATTVSAVGGKRLVTDGPFAETREQLGGYTLIDADNLTEAINIAASFLGNSSPSTIEIRPVLEQSETPTLINRDSMATQKKNKKRYLLLAYLDEKAWAGLGEEERQRIRAKRRPLVEQLVANGKFLTGAPLHPSATATTIAVRGGKRLVTDGPFVETREQLGGYALIEAENLDEAIAIADAFVATSDLSSIEIRPVLETDGMPQDAKHLENSNEFQLQ